MAWGRGWGIGPNPFWTWRWFPWLPRWWWMMPPEVLAQMQGQSYPPQMQQPETGQSGGIGGAPGGMPGTFGPFVPTMTKEQEIQMLEQQAEFLRQQLEQIQKRLNEMAEEE